MHPLERNKQYQARLSESRVGRERQKAEAEEARRLGGFPSVFVTRMLLFVFLARFLVHAIFPSSQRRGGRDIKKMPRSHDVGADGVVAHTETEFVSDHPVRAKSDRGLFLDEIGRAHV